ncbi:MAG: DUF1993 domain-containing protein [Pseudomonadota bacterium]
MSHGLFQVIPTLSWSLKNMLRVLEKGLEYANEKEIDPKVLFEARLFPDMLSFVWQIRIATDTAKGCAARLAGREAPVFHDDETEWSQLAGRVQRTIDYLATFKESDFDGPLDRRITLTLPKVTLVFTPQDYINHFVLPNYYFHMTTAYNLLRHNGVPLGKRHFLGKLG